MDFMNTLYESSSCASFPAVVVAATRRRRRSRLQKCGGGDGGGSGGGGGGTGGGGGGVQEATLVLLSDYIARASGCPHFLLDVAYSGMGELVQDLLLLLRDRDADAVAQKGLDQDVGVLFVKASLAIRTVAFHFRRPPHHLVLGDKGREELLNQLSSLMTALGSCKKRGGDDDDPAREMCEYTAALCMTPRMVSALFMTPRHSTRDPAKSNDNTPIPFVMDRHPQQEDEGNTAVGDIVFTTATGGHNMCNVFHWTFVCLQELAGQNAETGIFLSGVLRDQKLRMNVYIRLVCFHAWYGMVGGGGDVSLFVFVFDEVCKEEKMVLLHRIADIVPFPLLSSYVLYLAKHIL